VVWLVVLAALGACRSRDDRARGANRAPASKAAPSSPSLPAHDPTTLAVAAEDDAGLWSQHDGTGYANDVVRAAFRAAGVEIALEVVPYARCKQMLLAGEVAACFSMSQLPDLVTQVGYSAEPLFSCTSELVRRQGDTRFTDAQHIPKGSMVGTVLGYEYPSELDRLEAQGVIITEPSVSEELNLRKLAEGRLDAAVINDNATKPLDYMLAHAGVVGRVEHGFVLGELTAYVGFSHRHPRGAEAMARFDAGMRSIVADGTRARIDAAWAARALAEATALRARGGDAAPATPSWPGRTP
jgi:polar amino acid transport system substrate-binding protein